MPDTSAGREASFFTRSGVSQPGVNEVGLIYDLQMCVHKFSLYKCRGKRDAVAIIITQRLDSSNHLQTRNSTTKLAPLLAPVGMPDAARPSMASLI